jgi:hypothetical protein
VNYSITKEQTEKSNIFETKETTDKKSNTTENVRKRIDLSSRKTTFSDEDKKLIIKYLTRFIDYDMKMLDQYDNKIKELNDQKLRTPSDEKYITMVNDIIANLEQKRSYTIESYGFHQDNFLQFYNEIK